MDTHRHDYTVTHACPSIISFIYHHSPTDRPTDRLADDWTEPLLVSEQRELSHRVRCPVVARERGELLRARAGAVSNGGGGSYCKFLHLNKRSQRTCTIWRTNPSVGLNELFFPTLV